MRRWHDAHVGLARCASICCLSDAVCPIAFSSSAGTPAGGSGGGASSRLSSTHRPRSTGEVRVAYDDTVSTLACVSTPPRWPSVRSTRRNVGPVTPVHAVVLRQPLVEVRVLRVEELEDAPVLADDVLEEQHRLVAHREAQVVVEGSGTSRDRGRPTRGRGTAATVRRTPRPAPTTWHRRACGAPAPRARPACAACRRSASRRSSASGMLDQRKYDRRDASSCSLTGTACVPAVVATRSCSMRNRKSGETSSACSAIASASSNDSPAFCARAITATYGTSSSRATGRRKARWATAEMFLSPHQDWCGGAFACRFARRWPAVAGGRRRRPPAGSARDGVVSGSNGPASSSRPTRAVLMGAFFSAS